MAIGIIYELWALMLDENDFLRWQLIHETSTEKEAGELAELYIRDGVDIHIDRRYA